MMSKLLKLKEWITVPDAAAYLSDALAETVTEADILRFSLDGHLTLSVYLPNGAEVKRGKVVTHSIDEVVSAIANDQVPDDLNWTHFPKNLLEKGMTAIHEDCSETVPFITSLRLDDSRWITLNHKRVVTVWGVWDLPMMGGERLDIEHKYLSLTGGPAITAETLDGAFIWRGPDDICQIQQDFDDNPYQRGSKAHGNELKQRIAAEGIEKEQADALLEEYQKERREYKEWEKNKPTAEHYHPHGALPEDAVYVVRTAALKEFERTITEPSEKEISTRERDTLYKIIIGMAVRGYAHDPSAQRSNAIADIVRDLQHVGVPVSDDTVRKYIKEAAAVLERKPA